MQAILGELIIARYAPRVSDDYWQIESPQAACHGVLRGQLFSNQNEAEYAIKFLVPAPCRPYVRFTK